VPELNLTCACAGVSLAIEETSPRTGIRYVCHCDDCQAYAEFLGRSDTALDANGGTDAYQLPASRVRVTGGKPLLACMQATSRPLLRWYCSACRTPVANTYHTSKLSFVALPLSQASDPARDEVLGPSSGHAWTKFAWGDLKGARQIDIPAMLWRIASRILAARLTGDWRNNPFFDADGRPISPPRRLTASERAELDREAQRRAAS
jgi:hypothetical protein